MDVNSPYKTKSIDRLLDIIEYFTPDNRETGVSEIGRQLGLHKSTVHRLLTCLEDRGFVDKNEDNSKYRLSSKFIGLGFMVLDNMEIKKEVNGEMEELAHKTHKTVHLSVKSGNEAMYLHKVENPNNVIRYSRVGKNLPMYCTAMGKVILSGFSEKDLRKYLETVKFQRFTDNTILNKEKLIQEIEKVRKKGYGIDNEELEIGLKCVAVPVLNNRGDIVAAISASGVTQSMEEMQLLIQDLRVTADIISPSLMYFNRIEAV